MDRAALGRARRSILPSSGRPTGGAPVAGGFEADSMTPRQRTGGHRSPRFRVLAGLLHAHGTFCGSARSCGRGSGLCGRTVGGARFWGVIRVGVLGVSSADGATGPCDHRIKRGRRGSRPGSVHAPSSPLGECRESARISSHSGYQPLSHRTQALAIGGPRGPKSIDPIREPELDETWARVCRLPFRQRAVLALRYYADLPEAEIAADPEVPGRDCEVGPSSSDRRPA